LCALCSGATRGAAQVSTTAASRGGTLLLVRASGDENIVRRILAEPEVADWHVVELAPEPHAARVALAELAASQSADAALRVEPGKAQLEMWVSGATSDAPESLETLSAQDADQAVLAVRVAEVLRARGLALARDAQATPPKRKPEQAAHAPEPPAPQKSEPSSPVDAPAQVVEPVRVTPQSPPTPAAPAPQEPEVPEPTPSYPRIWLELAPTIALASGGLGPALDGWVSLRLQPAAAWSFGVFALVPLLSERLRQPEGSASVATWMAGAGGQLRMLGDNTELTLDAGLGAIVSQMSGSARPPLRSATETVLAVGALAGPALHLQLSGSLRLVVMALTGIAIPRLAIDFAGRRVARWGRPFALGTLGLEFAF
jgi:hypothetical protein